MKRALILGFAAVLATGCQGAPQQGWNTDRSSPGNHLGAGRFYIDLNSQSNITATGVKSGRHGMFETQFNADSLTITQSPAAWDGLVNGMDAYGRQQVNFGNVVLPAYSAGAVAILQQVPPIIQAATPLVGPYLNALSQAKLAAATRPGVVSQLAAAIAQGTLTPAVVKSTFQNIDPALAADVLNQTSQPVDQSNTLEPVK